MSELEQAPSLPPHLAPDAPVLELVERLHAGTTLRERVIKLRWKRKKPMTTITTVPPIDDYNLFSR